MRKITAKGTTSITCSFIEGSEHTFGRFCRLVTAKPTFFGGLAEWFNVTVLKTVEWEVLLRKFESFTLRHVFVVLFTGAWVETILLSCASLEYRLTVRRGFLVPVI